MPPTIRRLEPADVAAVVAFSLRAWVPVFTSFEQVLGTGIYRRIFPDWSAGQAQAVEQACSDGAATVWVAVADDRPVGFVAVTFHDEGGARAGEIDMLAVDPDVQRHGVAAALISVALENLRKAGVRLAVVATGGDPGHAPARHAYESAGFTALPQVRYYKAL